MQRRKLILVSKALQSLSNGIEFGEKEAYMMGVNKFIRSKRHAMQDLQLQLAVCQSPYCFDNQFLDALALSAIPFVACTCHRY
jgi:hypothetical protein